MEQLLTDNGQGGAKDVEDFDAAFGRRRVDVAARAGHQEVEERLGLVDDALERLGAVATGQAVGVFALGHRADADFQTGAQQNFQPPQDSFQA
ncbi:MAG: hypothetical protein ACOCZE_06420, partial [Planctomycetota bacterium]